MPKLATPLTDIKARNAKPKDKAYTLADGGGMYLEVAPSGSKTWRMSVKSSSDRISDCQRSARSRRTNLRYNSL